MSDTVGKISFIDTVPTIEELFKNPTFLGSFTDASRKLARKTNALEIAIAYTTLSVLQELREIKALLAKMAGVKPVEEDTQVKKEKEAKRTARRK